MATILSRERAGILLRVQGVSTGSLVSRLAYFQTTHLGPDGKPLEVSGHLDGPTSWALKHPVGKAQKSGLKPEIPPGIPDQRYRILELAIGEHAKGVKESPSGSNRSKDIDKYLPKWLINKLPLAAEGPPWCAYFVNWVVHSILGGYPWGGNIGSCKRLVEAAMKSHNCRVFTDPQQAAPGDIFVILRGATGHTGLILRKNVGSTMINTVEGNCGNRVKVGLRETKDITRYINVCPIPLPDSLTSPLLDVENVGAAGTR